MTSPPPSSDRPSLTPLSTFCPRRATLSENSYAPPTSSPLSPHSASLSPLETSVATTNSHYYRPPRSSLTSPTRSNISSPTHSPTRTSRQSRIRSLLATDPLLSHLTPVTITHLSTSGAFDFEPGEKEWSLRAVEGTIKVNEWLREVEGWNREWRRSYRGNKDAGDGYLPPTDRPKKRQKTGMGSIREEEEDSLLDGPRSVRRRLFSEDSSTGRNGGVIAKDDTPKIEAVETPKPQADSPGPRRGGKPLTPYQLKVQRQKAAEAEKDLMLVNGTPEPYQTPVKPAEKIDVKEKEEEEEEGDGQDDELEEGVEYWGSLKRSVVEGYEARIEAIKSEVEELDVDGLKDRVLSYRTGTANPLTDSSAVMAATTLQLLPPLSRLTKLLSIWAVRIGVLRVVPVFLRWLQIAKDALGAGYIAINHPSINPESSSVDRDWRGLEEESYTLMQETITQKVATAGRLMDTMLDALEGREDVLPERWIAELEDVEEGVGRWEMDGERVVLEGRLRLEEMRMRQSRQEEEAREREKTLLVLEQERSAQEARAEEGAAMDVMEKAEETDRQLREALETNDIVAEAIELPDDDENDWIEPGRDWEGLEELFSKLEDVEKERPLPEEDEERGRRPERDGGIGTAPSLHGVGNHRDPPEPPATSEPLVVGEDQNEFLPVEGEPELPTASNGTFFSRLFSAIPQTPLRKAKQTSEEAHLLPAVVPPGVSEEPASEPAVNVSATLPEETTRPRLSQQKQDGDERFRSAISQQMEQNLNQGQSAWGEPPASSSLAQIEKPEEEGEEREGQSEEGENREGKEGKNELQGTFADDEAIRLKIVQQMEKLVIDDFAQSWQVEAGAISVDSIPEPARTFEQPQSQPQSALLTEDDEQIRQRITRDMERSLAGTSASQPEQQKGVGVESSQPVVATPSAVLNIPTVAAPKRSQFPTEGEEIRQATTRGVVQSTPTGCVAQPEIKRESQQMSLSSVQPFVVPVVGDIPTQRPQAQLNTPQDDEAVRHQIQKEMQRLLESGGTLSTSTAVVAVDEPVERTVEEPAEEKSPFSTPPRSVRHPSPPIIGDDDQIRRKIVTEMEQFVNQNNVPHTAAPSGPTNLEPQQRILQPEPRSVITPAGGNKDELIRQRIVRQMEEMMIHDTTPAVDEPALQEPVSHVAEVVEQAIPVPYTTTPQTVPAPQAISPDDDERIRRKVIEEMETLLQGGTIPQLSQPITVQPAVPVLQAIAQPTPISVPTSPETLAGDEEIKQRVTAEMEESLKNERSRAAEGTSGQSGAQQAALHVESEKVVGGKRESGAKEEAERQRLALGQAGRERIMKLAKAEEKTLEAEAHNAAELEAQRLAEQDELAEKARLELEAKNAAEAERLLAEVAVEKEKVVELERLAEAERQRLDAQRHEEESAAAKTLEERRAVETERAAVVEAARQVFVNEQAGFDDKKFQELDRQRRLAEDERVRLADMALAEREEAREVRQQAERARREWEIEERVKREASAQEANNTLGVDASDTGAGGFRGIETSSAATVKDDLASDVFDTAAESDGSGGNLDYSDIWKAQTGHETPRAIQGPVIGGVLVGEVGRSLECVMATSESPAPSPSMPMGQPAAIKLPSPPNSDDQGYKLSDEVGVKPFVEMPSNLAHLREEISQTISDIDSSDDGEKEGKREKEATLAFDELLIADDSADEYMAPDGGEPVKLMMGCEDVQATGLSELLPPETFVKPETLAKGLGNIPNLSPPGQSVIGTPEGSRSIVDIRHYDDGDFLLSRGYSFDTPSIVLAPSTPQKRDTLQKGDSREYNHDDFVATPRRSGMSSQFLDTRNGSFDISFSCASMGEGEADMSDSMSYLEQEESSEIEIKPVATSTPKGNRRLTVSTGLDSIVEVLTPRSTRGQCFDKSDVYRNDGPGLGGFSGTGERASAVEDSVSSSIIPDEGLGKEMLPIELPEKVTEREISRDPTRATSASKNRSVAPRSSTPTLGKGLMKDQKQRFTLGSGSVAPSATTVYKRPTSRAEARPSSRQGNRPSSRAQEFRPPSRAQDAKVSRPSPRAGLSTPGGPADDGSNSSTPTGTPAPAVRPMRRLHRDTVSTTGADSDDDDDPRRFLREDTPDMNNSPDFVRAPKLQVSKRHARQPSNPTSTVTPEKSSRLNTGPYAAEGSTLIPPTTPILPADLDDKINEILGSLPSKVRLTASNLQKLSESTNRQPPIKPFDLSSPTGIPGPKSVGSSPSVASEVPSYARPSARRHNSSSPGDIKLYHLHRTDGQTPIKLYIRLVGENGERVMVRVGGGWADLAEYLKEYVTHHGSKRRVVSEGRVEIQDLSTHSHHGRTLHPSRSISSFRSVSPGPMGSRPSSPGGNRPSTSLSMRRPESPMLMKRSESENPSLHINPTTMRGGHNGTLPGNNKTPTTPPDEAFPLHPITAPQLTPPNRSSPPSRPASRPGSSSSAGYRRPTSRLSFSESAFGDCGSANGCSPPSLLPPPQPLGLAGPKGKYVHPDNQAWVEGMLGQVRKASADRRAQLLAATGHYGEGGAEEAVVEGSMAVGGGGGDYGGREFGGRLGEIGKAGGTKRLFAKKG